MDYSIRLLSEEDCKNVAEIHVRAFPGSIFSKLGSEVARRYYALQLRDQQNCFGLGIFHSEKMVGFLFAGNIKGFHATFLNQNRGYLLRQVLTHPWIVFSSESLAALKAGLAILFPAKKPIQPSVPLRKLKTIRIRYLAIAPLYQGKGLGTVLMKKAEKEVMARGMEKMVLSVDRTNHAAIRCYEKIGWQADQMTDWHETMITMSKVVDPEEGFPVY